MALRRFDTGWTDLTTDSEFKASSNINNSAHHAEDIAALLADDLVDLPASGNWGGRRIWMNDSAYFWNGTSWVAEFQDSGWRQVIVLGPGFDQYSGGGYPPITIRREVVGGSATLKIRGVFTTPGGAHAGDLMGTLPAEFRPLYTSQIPAIVGDAIGFINVNTDGTIVADFTNPITTITIITTTIPLD